MRFLVVACLLCAMSAHAQERAGTPGFPSMEEILRAAQPELRKAPGSTAGAPSATFAPPSQPAQKPPATAGGAADRDRISRGAPAQAAAPAAEPPSSSARLMALARQYRGQQPVPISLLHGSFYVAVSFSMPEETLRRLVEQTAAAGGTVIFRGFDGTPQKTQQRLSGLLGAGTSTRAAWAGRAAPKVTVLPQMFDRFDLREVPAFVLVSPTGSKDDCIDRRCPAYGDFVTVQGDVTVAHALQTVARMRPAFKASADYYAKRADVSISQASRKP